MLKEFKEFINRGNVVDLAVAVIIGGAFALVIKSFTDDILGGVIAAVGGQPDMTQAFVLTIGDGKVRFGSFLTALINFLIVAFAMFLVVKLINTMQDLRAEKEAEEAAVEATELELLTEIRDLLRDRDLR